ncbi:MAG: NADH-quinone oxidoreductase subunit J [Actinobacteria bacterium]|nr:NADH-quinone oxidoreductase subunit J [Actinomycetota bacterium]MCB9390466.1 NADH-quinone oxidoreductase subunit J [Acidimicrobiia bacterium]
MDWVVFLIASAAALGCACGVILSRNPVHSAMMLVGTLFSIAVLFVAQAAHFLAAVQVMVYAGAIVVMFLFVIMLLGIDVEETLSDSLVRQKPLALALGAVTAVEAVLLTRMNWTVGTPSIQGPIGGPDGNAREMAEVLFTKYVWAFELTAVLLVIGIVGAVVLVRRRPTEVSE